MPNKNLLVLLVLLISALGRTQADNSGPRPNIAVPFATITPLVTADPSDSAWTTAADIPALVDCIGVPSDAGFAKTTEVKLLWDKQYLYIRFINQATEIYSPFKNFDDPLYKGDVDELFLDIKGDSRQWVELEVSPNNVVYEAMTTLTADPQSDQNLLLDANILNRDYWQNTAWTLTGLRSACRIEKDSKTNVTGWITDIALPATPTLQRLGLNSYGPIAFKANFLRYEYPAPKDKTSSRSLVAQDWGPVLLGCPHISPEAMGNIQLVN